MFVNVRRNALHILLNLAMLFVLFLVTTATPNRYVWGFPFFQGVGSIVLTLQALLTSNIPIAIITVSIIGIIGLSVYRFGVRRLFSGLQRVFLGEGWAAWTMFWLWMVGILAFSQPATFFLLTALGSTASFGGVFSGALAMTVGLILFHRVALTQDTFPVRAAIISVVAAIAVWLVSSVALLPILRNVANWTQLLGVSTPDDVLVAGAAIIRFPLEIMLALVILSRRTGFTNVLRILIIVLTGGMIAAFGLLYPAYSLLFANYVPQDDIIAVIPNYIMMAGASISLVALLISGIIASVWVRPTNIMQRFLIGAFVGALIGMFVSAVIGSWFAGVAAQSPLYGFAYTREGYNEAEWTLQLAIAVNNVFPASSLAWFGSIAISTIVAAIGAVFTPLGLRRDAQANKNAWVRIATISMLFVHSSAITIFIVLNLLDDTIADLLNNYGYVPLWQPMWLLPLLIFPLLGIIVASQVAVIHWLRGQDVLEGRLRNAIVIVSLLVLFSALYLIIQRNWLAIFYSVLTIGFSLEILRLAISTAIDNTNDVSRLTWVGDGLLAGTIGMLTGYLFVGIALSLVLIAVVLIVPLADVTADPPGIDFIIETIDTTIIVTINGTLALLSMYLFIGGTMGILFGLDVVGRLFNSIKSFAQNPLITNRLPDMSLKVWQYGVLIVALIVDWLIALPIATSIWVLVYIRPNSQWRNARLQMVMLVAFITIAGITLRLATDAMPLLFSRSLLLAIVPAAIVLIRLSDSFVTESTRSQRHVLYVVALAISFALIVRWEERTPQSVGGVSSFDGTSWTAYDQDNSTLGQRLYYAMTQDTNGTLWFANEGGIISTRNPNNEWEIAMLPNDTLETAVTNTLSVVNELTDTDIEAVAVPHLAAGHDNTIWYGLGDTLGNIAPNTEGDAMLTFSTSCDDDAFDEDCSVIIPSLRERGQRILAMDSTDDGALRVVTQQSLLDVFWRYRDTENLPTGATIASIATSGDDVWATTNTQLFHWELVLSELQTYPLPEGCVGCSVYAGSDGGAWLASAQGVWKVLEDGTSEVGISNATLLDAGVAHVTSLAIDGDAVWIGTSNAGLLRVEGSEVVTFNANNSGLVTNHVRDILIADDGSIWVTTFELDIPFSNGLMTLLVGLVTGGFIIFSMLMDYRQSPIYRAKRTARDIVQKDEALFSNIYTFLASEPDTEALTLTAQELKTMSLPTAGGIIASVAQLQTDPASVDTVAETLATVADNPAFANYYQLVQRALAVQHISQISQLDLMVNPSSDTQSVTLTTRNLHDVQVPPYVHQDSKRVWFDLSEVSLNLRKYAEVNETNDRLSYLATALTGVENAQQATQVISLPDDILLKTVINRWRGLIADAINLLSGSAFLRLELRTRQVKRNDSVTLVVKVENIGRATAETVRVMLNIASEQDNPERQTIAYLSPNRSQSLEFSITPSDAETQRITVQALWNDRTATDRSVDYADEVRFYEEVEEFNLIPNPYIVGHPVKSSQMFFGREDVFQFVAQNLSGAVQDRTIVLYGQRRTGKTSLLYQLVDGRLGENFLAVLVDMQALVLLVETTADFLGEILYQIEQTLDKANVAIDVPQIDSDTPSPNRVFNRFIDQLSRELGDKRLLIIFDEFELIESKIADNKLDRNLLDYFRSLIQHRDNLVFIFTGTHRLEEMSHDYWSILFNIALTRKVSFLSQADTVALIRKPVADTLTVDDLAVEKIQLLTNGHPFFTQLLCWALVNHCNEIKHNYATINDVNDSVDTMLNTGEAHFAYMWQQAGADAQLLLATMAQLEHTWLDVQQVLDVLAQHSVDKISRNDAITVLDKLVSQELLETTTNGRLQYRFVLGVQHIWIRRTKSLDGLIERQESE